MDVARQRLQQQRLLGPGAETPEDVVAGLLAVQAQDYAGAKWAIAQRTRAADDVSVQTAFQEGRILRTHVLRPTWHFVRPDDIRWLLELTAPRVHAVNAYYYRQHGMDAGVVKRSNARIVQALSRGEHLTRDELAAVLGQGGAEVSGNRLACFIMHAELDGLICSGPMRGKQHTYALLDERAPQAQTIERDEALARLAHGYVSGHGPAQAQDLAWWSGLTVADAKRGFEASRETLERTVIDDETYWFVPAPPAPRRTGPVVHLLPNYDELLIAFKDRRLMLDPQITPITSVLSAHFVVIDARLVGGWRRTLAKHEVLITAQLLRPLSAPERQALDRAAARYAQSLGLAFRLEAEVVG